MGVLAGRVWRNDRLAASLDEPVTQLARVIGAVSQKLARRGSQLEQGGGSHQVVRVARRQDERSGPPQVVGQRVDFRGPSAAGGADGVVEGPPFAPPAERCALT